MATIKKTVDSIVKDADTLLDSLVDVKDPEILDEVSKLLKKAVDVINGGEEDEDEAPKKKRGRKPKTVEKTSVKKRRGRKPSEEANTTTKKKTTKKSKYSDEDVAKLSKKKLAALKSLAEKRNIKLRGRPPTEEKAAKERFAKALLEDGYEID